MVGVGASVAPARFSALMSPARVGPLRLRNRIMVPPHGGRIGNIWGTEADAQRFVDYWACRAEGGAAWVCGLTIQMPIDVIPGFDATGAAGSIVYGAHHRPEFVARVSRYVEAVHAYGAVASAQLMLQGGGPFGPSQVAGSAVAHTIPHALTVGEIGRVVEHYADAAAKLATAGIDGIEVHLNHGDLLDWFISPATNLRQDEYGGSVENRLRLPGEVLRAIRGVVGADVAVGARLNLFQNVPNGYTAEDMVEYGRCLDQLGVADYFSVVIGSSWGNPSYIPPHWYPPAAWAPSAATFRAAVSVPVVYSGRVTSVEVAEQVIAAGQADLVGMARAHIADPGIARKAMANRSLDIRPCVGCNECISGPIVEGIPFGCAVNPLAGRERDASTTPATRSGRRIVVVGGGPAGMECAAASAERGHRVTLYERESVLGGQLRIAAMAPGYEDFASYLAWQGRRLEATGVDVQLGRSIAAEDLLAMGPDDIVVATGAQPRRPVLPGADAPHVRDIREVLTRRVTCGGRVVVVAQDDHIGPMSVALLLAADGCAVSIVYEGPAPAPLLSSYMLGPLLGELDALDVSLITCTRVVSVLDGSLLLANTFSGRERVLDHVDNVVLACGSVADDTLYHALLASGAPAHVVGDAYAPRRLIYATKQANALAREL